MVSTRTLTAAVGVVASLAISAAAWYYFNSLVLFLFVPFVPFLFRRTRNKTAPEERVCPVCDFRTRNPEYGHCPRDGTRLEERKP